MQLEKKGEMAASGADGAEPPDLEGAFAQIVENEIFRAAPVLRTLLVYLWNRRNSSTSEYAVAVEALGRRPDFDPKTDAAVRVHVARLRAKLKEFYLGQEPEFPLRLSIPLGGHQLQYCYAPVSASGGRSEADATPKAARSRRLAVALAAVSVGLAFLSAALAIQNRKLRAIVPKSQAALPRFWRSFISDGKPIAIVVPTPVYFHWDSLEISVRDHKIIDFSDLPSSAPLRDLTQRWGPPRLSQTYTVVRDVVGAVQILQYLQDFGQHVQFVPASNLTVEAAGNQNTIFIGIPQSMDRIHDLLETTNFYIEVGGAGVVQNRKPKTGELKEYAEEAQSPRRRTTPGIIALLPRDGGAVRTLVLAGRNPTSLAWLLTSDEGLKVLEQERRRGGSPDYFEMAVEAEIDGDAVLKVWPVGFRQVPLNTAKQIN
jgi:hypothetical protein